MTGPKDPGDEDWGFPEVDPAGPASVQLPEPEPEPEVVYDTGSDAWWRAQAQAQRRAAESDPVVPPATPTAPAPAAPPEVVEPEVLLPEPPPGPLDSTWLPPDLSAPAPPVPPAPPVSPATPAPPAPPRVVTRPTPPTPPTPPPAPVPPADPDPAGDAGVPDDGPSTRAPYEGQPIGPGKAVAGAAIAVAGVALGIGALLLFNKSDTNGTPTVASPPSASASPSTQPTTEPTTRPTPSATVPVVVPPPTAGASPALAPVVPITVLNNSRIQHLAEREAARFEAGGWPVPHKGNYRGGVISATTVYYGPGQLASAQRFAKQFGIGRVLPRFAGLPGTGVTVVLTRDYH